MTQGEGKKFEAIGVNPGRGREGMFKIRGAEYYKSEQGPQWNTLFLPLSLSILPHPAALAS